jgi:hypothetical protein
MSRILRILFQYVRMHRRISNQRKQRLLQLWPVKLELLLPHASSLIACTLAAQLSITFLPTHYTTAYERDSECQQRKRVKPHPQWNHHHHPANPHDKANSSYHHYLLLGASRA